MYIKVEGVTSSAFVRVDFYSPMCDHKSQELASANPKSTFFRVEAHVIFTELFEDLFLSAMCWAMLRLDDYVVDIDLDVSSDLLLENLVHQSLVCSAYIF